MDRNSDILPDTLKSCYRPTAGLPPNQAVPSKMAQGAGSADAQSEVDVLIVGAGPAGLMMANWMSRCGIRTRIVDKRGTKVCNISSSSVAS